ncbi:hypothetical protein DM02DRAFT_690062 [Periconia macrospinosa]|uniref:Uncharacterized protein n=1 Tax=Periconia macrospinosa TaxID=97972 RepID=A0A2V1DD14_9PLEO|nr:hypothetical protein DM02DRAFT_690062 [Periconia macrospinosa]
MSRRSDISDDERGLLGDSWVERKEQNRWSICIASIICLIVGFTLGAFSHRLPTHEISRERLDTYSTSAPFEQDVGVVFKPNITFENATPGRDADALWDTLMPSTPPQYSVHMEIR